MTFTLTSDLAAKFAGIALGHVTLEYPHRLDQVLTGLEDVLPPSTLHPIFHGSFDWHSCVHGYWLLLRLRRLYPKGAFAEPIEALADRMLTPAKVAGELAYLDRAYSGGFQRPYGWAWLLALHREAMRADDRDWTDALDPLAAAFAERFHDFLPRLTYPIRAGVHSNTAFALILALDWAEANDATLAALIRARALDYYGADQGCAGWEPGGDEFLSTAMTEALLMRRVLGATGFVGWFEAFLPRLRDGAPASLFTPATVSDRTDGKIVHLDGFNLGRAWCWRGIADALPADLATIAADVADRHVTASIDHVAGDYMGEHWLATFALLALDGL